MRHHIDQNIPQHNGVAESINQTLVERGLFMLSNARLSNSFWAKAFVMACYLVNWSSSVPLEFKTPRALCLEKSRQGGE